MLVEYIPRTRELYNSYTPYRWVVNSDTPPWIPLVKPLADCKVALMSSGGILYRDQPRFHREDASYRLIPKNATQADLDIWHFGYRTADAESDHNCVFPLARMRELESDGTIGELADPAYSFMGGIYSARKVREELAPQIADELKKARIDAFYLVPA
ncbi:MAG TPA: glycine/sarcosine/betaine reductase selenoprotein B family protein [Candidatus Binataceae bacterium]|nr:glycine/sarcosine/betaine reductase selenoprotein B family protein [Candidatus Binataceae bacterium]